MKPDVPWLRQGRGSSSLLPRQPRCLGKGDAVGASSRNGGGDLVAGGQQRACCRRERCVPSHRGMAGLPEPCPSQPALQLSHCWEAGRSLLQTGFVYPGQHEEQWVCERQRWTKGRTGARFKDAVTAACALELPTHEGPSTRVGSGWERAPSPALSLNLGTQRG